jgi:outer membrane receptor protein involved in Fe transport
MKALSTSRIAVAGIGRRPLLALAALIIVGGPRLSFGQVAPLPATGQTAAAEEPVTLSPFEVTADTSDTYDPANTNSVTGTNMSLLKTPLNAQIFNRNLMDEQGVVDMALMLSSLGGFGDAIQNSGNEDQRGTREGDSQDYKTMTSRGLTISNPRRDGFLRSDTSLMDSFDAERVEGVEGSNSLLFGSGDAGGVITTSSKQAQLKRRSVKVGSSFDSEGSARGTLDANYGLGKLALRLNLMKGQTKFYRPILGQVQDGVHLALTAKPVDRVLLRAEYRKYHRNAVINGGGTISAPTSILFTNPDGTTRTLNGLDPRAIVGMRGGAAQLNHLFSLENSDSIFGALRSHNYTSDVKGVTMEARLADDLFLQARYGKDARINRAVSPNSSSIFSPTSPTNPLGVWATQNSPVPAPNTQGTEGYRVALAYHRSLGRWGEHKISAFMDNIDSWSIAEAQRFYLVDASGNVVTNPSQITNSESGRTVMPAMWLPIFPTSFYNSEWPGDTILQSNGSAYKLQRRRLAGAVTPTATNPLGLSGPNPDTQTEYTWDKTNEKGMGGSIYSSFWGGRIDTMAGARFDKAETVRMTTGVKRGPINYHSTTFGAVVNTPIEGMRLYANVATNAKINFDTSRDIYNQPLPVGAGVSREIGLKFALWEHRVSGNINYYVSEAKNFTATLGTLQNDIDPPGINGRNGGGSYLYSKKSDGLGVTLSVQPTRNWDMRIHYIGANGAERSDVNLPIFYNDEFNTMTSAGQTVVAVKDSASGSLSPLMVRQNPLVSSSPLIPLAVSMLKDPGSAYFAQLDPDSGYILNAQALGLQTPGVGTAKTGLPIAQHQLGFVPPAGGTMVARRAGERTTGYAEDSFSWINRYRFTEGWARGLSVGLTTVLKLGYRAYRYTDTADGGTRKTFYTPDSFLNNAFVGYPFKLSKAIRASVQLNVTNVFDTNTVVNFKRSTDGTYRYSYYQNSPRKFTLTTSLSY